MLRNDIFDICICKQTNNPKWATFLALCCAEPTNDNELLYFLYEIYVYIIYRYIYVPHTHTCTCAAVVMCDDDDDDVCVYACAICCSS